MNKTTGVTQSRGELITALQKQRIALKADVQKADDHFKLAQEKLAEKRIFQTPKQSGDPST